MSVRSINRPRWIVFTPEPQRVLSQARHLSCLSSYPQPYDLLLLSFFQRTVHVKKLSGEPTLSVRLWSINYQPRSPACGLEEKNVIPLPIPSQKKKHPVLSCLLSIRETCSERPLTKWDWLFYRPNRLFYRRRFRVGFVPFPPSCSIDGVLLNRLQTYWGPNKRPLVI